MGLEILGGIVGFCVLCVLREHIELSLSTAGGIIEPYKLVDNLTCILFHSPRLVIL